MLFSENYIVYNALFGAFYPYFSPLLYALGFMLVYLKPISYNNIFPIILYHIIIFSIVIHYYNNLSFYYILVIFPIIM